MLVLKQVPYQRIYFNQLNYEQNERIYKLLLAVLMLSSYSAKAQYDGVTFTF